MSDWILDASALLAYIHDEEGADRVEDVLSGDVAISAVNLSEVISKLTDARWSEDAIYEAIELAAVPVADFDETAAFRAGLLWPATRQRGLSLGDRACLALAAHYAAPALTADRVWADLDTGIPVVLIR